MYLFILIFVFVHNSNTGRGCNCLFITAELAKLLALYYRFMTLVFMLNQDNYTIIM